MIQFSSSHPYKKPLTYLICTSTRHRVVDKQNIPRVSYFYYTQQAYNNCLRIVQFYLFCLPGDVS